MQCALEMAQAPNGPVFVRAVDDIFSGWILRGRLRPLMIKKTSKKIFELGEPLGVVKSE